MEDGPSAHRNGEDFADSRGELEQDPVPILDKAAVHEWATNRENTVWNEETFKLLVQARLEKDGDLDPQSSSL